MRYVINYFEEYYSVWLKSMDLTEFLKLFKMYQTRIKKLSDIPREATWFRENISDKDIRENDEYKSLRKLL